MKWKNYFVLWLLLAFLHASLPAYAADPIVEIKKEFIYDCWKGFFRVFRWYTSWSSENPEELQKIEIESDKFSDLATELDIFFHSPLNIEDSIHQIIEYSTANLNSEIKHAFGFQFPQKRFILRKHFYCKDYSSDSKFSGPPVILYGIMHAGGEIPIIVSSDNAEFPLQKFMFSEKVVDARPATTDRKQIIQHLHAVVQKLAFALFEEEVLYSWKQYCEQVKKIPEITLGQYMICRRF